MINYIVVYAISKSNNFSDFKPFLDNADLVVYTKPDMFKIVDPNEYVDKGSKVIMNVQNAYDFCKSKMNNNDLLVVCGSIFLIGEILSLLEKKK